MDKLYFPQSYFEYPTTNQHHSSFPFRIRYYAESFPSIPCLPCTANIGHNFHGDKISQRSTYSSRCTDLHSTQRIHHCPSWNQFEIHHPTNFHRSSFLSHP